MKHLKIVGLAVVAVMALTAVLGAGTASATSLCKVTAGSGACPAASIYTGSVSGAAGTTTLTTNIAVVTCTSSATGGATVNSQQPAGSPATGTLSSLTFSGCTTNSGKTSCTVTSVHTPYNSAALWTSGDNGTFTPSSGGSGAPGATVVCGSLINCTFSNPGALEFKGGSAASIVANEVSLARTGGICPSTSTWKATYATTPAALFLSKS